MSTAPRWPRPRRSRPQIKRTDSLFRSSLGRLPAGRSCAHPGPVDIRTLPVCSAMCLAGREHSPTGKQKEEKQQQKQPLPMAPATECSKLPFLYVGLRPTVAQLRRGGLRKDARPGRMMVVETCEDLSARRVRVGLVYGNVTAVRWVVRPMLDERLQHLV